MSRQKRFLEINVLEAARARITRLYDEFDSVVVMFSGGKDSLTVLSLCREEATRRGRLPVKAMFRDEEVIPDTVIDFVTKYHAEPWLDLKWLAVPLQSTKYLLGVVYDYVQWDAEREHVREAPEWAFRLPPGDTRVFDQYTMDAFSATFYTGRIVFVTGIRADESLMRYRASVNKLGMDSYLSKTAAPNVMLAKPIYDWSENDIFKYLGEAGVAYCPIYDMQMWGGERMRVSTPLHQERAKTLAKMRGTDPRFFERVMQVFPEMEEQARYYRDIDLGAIKAKYGKNYASVLRYINEKITEPRQHEKALTAFRSAVRRANSTGRHLYPPEYLLGVFMGGGYKRVILPMAGKKAVESDG